MYLDLSRDFDMVTKGKVTLQSNADVISSTTLTEKKFWVFGFPSTAVDALPEFLHSFFQFARVEKFDAWYA
ncbi:hypothetical protein ACHAQC_002497 [Fusarium culmorum]